MLTDSPISTESEQILSTFILQECAFELETVMQIPPDTRNYSVELKYYIDITFKPECDFVVC